MVFGDPTGMTAVSGPQAADLATLADLALKQDAETGKGLSANDYTDADKAALLKLGAGGYQGSFATFADMVAGANSLPGAWAIVAPGSDPDAAVAWIWNEADSSWKAWPDLTGAEISARLYAEADTNRYTDNDQAMVHGSVQRTGYESDMAEIRDQIGLARNDVTPDAASARLLSRTDDMLLLAPSAAVYAVTIPSDASGGMADPVTSAPLDWNLWVDILVHDGDITVAPASASGVVVDNASAARDAAPGTLLRVKRVGADRWRVLPAARAQGGSGLRALVGDGETLETIPRHGLVEAAVPSMGNTAFVVLPQSPPTGKEILVANTGAAGDESIVVKETAAGATLVSLAPGAQARFTYTGAGTWIWA
jgi:hypothetical protein